jgi:hypothetical protein
MPGTEEFTEAAKKRKFDTLGRTLTNARRCREKK